MSRWFVTVGVVGLIILQWGCSGEKSRFAPVSPMDYRHVGQSLPAELVSNTNKSAAAGGAVALSEVQPRMVVYTADLDLVVKDLDHVQGLLPKLLAKYPGSLIARSEVRGKVGSQRRGSWRLRVPAPQLEPLLADLLTLGELQRQSLDSQDKTEEYVDTDARLKNLTAQEARLKEHLQKSTGKLEDILACEKEINRVRSEIDSLQARLNVIRDQVALSTVNLVLTEIQDYIPPSAPTLVDRIRRAWNNGWENQREMGENLLIGLVGQAPWMPFWALALGLIVYGWRSRRRGARPAPVTTPIPPPTGPAAGPATA